jgi:hypothetical protein
MATARKRLNMVRVAGAAMAKKKPVLKTSVVKIDSGLARKAKLIAADKGVPVSEYLSSAIQAAVVKDWPRVLKTMGEAEGGDE